MSAILTMVVVNKPARTPLVLTVAHVLQVTEFLLIENLVKTLTNVISEMVMVLVRIRVRTLQDHINVGVPIKKVLDLQLIFTRVQMSTSVQKVNLYFFLLTLCFYYNLFNQKSSWELRLQYRDVFSLSHIFLKDYICFCTMPSSDLYITHTRN